MADDDVSEPRVDGSVATISDLRADMVRRFSALATKALAAVFIEAVLGTPRDFLNEVYIDSPKWLRKAIRRVLSDAGERAFA